MEASKTMAKACTHLLLRQPFFGALALGLKLVEDSGIKTMATDGKAIIYNPDFVFRRVPLDLDNGFGNIRLEDYIRAVVM